MGESNPYETRKERREKEVHRLLEKLPSDTIMLDPGRIGSIDKKIVDEYHQEVKQKQEEEEANKKLKKKARGKNKTGNLKKRKELVKARRKSEKIKGRIAG